jgi:type IV secretion system protein VirB10
VTASAHGDGDSQTVRGERSIALGFGTRSAQSRLSSLLAAGLMVALGVSALSWYYAHAFSRQSRTREAAQSGAASRAQGEMALPGLGRIEPPPAPAAPSVSAAASVSGAPSVPGAAAQIADPAAAVTPPAATDLPLEPQVQRPGTNSQSGTSAAPVAAQRTSPLERRLSGVVFARERSDGMTAGGADNGGAELQQAGGVDRARRAVEGGESALTTLLRPSATPAAPARVLPTQRFLLPRGAFIDCTLETAIDSTLPGMTTCITAADTFGADAKVVLLERGTKLVGETRGEVQQGQARIFVLWTEARTPAGVIVPLDSPGTDELGRSGLPGEVRRHFFERFGAAMLVTLIDGAVQAGVQASAHSGGTVIYTPSGSQEVLTEVLKDTLRIPPTVVKRNGERIQVLVARDIDFRPVYELHAPDTGR